MGESCPQELPRLSMCEHPLYVNGQVYQLADTVTPFVENTSHFPAHPRLFAERVLLRFKVVFERAPAMVGAFSLLDFQ